MNDVVTLILGGGPAATTVELAIYQAIRFEADFSGAAQLALLQYALCGAAAALAFALTRGPVLGTGLGRAVERWDAGSWASRLGDAAGIGALDGSIVRITTKAGSAEVPVEVTDTMHVGHISLPNGLGLDYPDADGTRVRHGVAPNELTSVDNRDWFAGTPLHKNVRARLEVVAP